MRTADLAATILRREEGLRLRVYDDATGKPIGPGSRVVGHPTIGYGRALDVRGIDEDEAEDLLAAEIEAIIGALALQPWWGGLTETRQAVLVSMAYQMGVGGLLAFKQTLAMIARRDYEAAGDQMLRSLWARQTPARAERMAKLLRDG